MHAVIVHYEILDALLEAVDVDEREHEDGVRAVGEFGDS